MPKGIGYGGKKPSKLKRRVKELVGGSKTYQKGHVELKAGEATRKLRRAKNRAAAKPMVGKETNAQKERRTRVSTQTSRSSTPSYGDWLKKTGKGATAATSMQYQRMKRNR
jgi:hypothetical protein